MINIDRQHDRQMVEIDGKRVKPLAMNKQTNTDTYASDSKTLKAAETICIKFNTWRGKAAGEPD